MAFNKKSTPDAQALIQSIVDAEIIFQRHQASGAGQPPVVALSRGLGAGGTEVAQLLCRRLGVELYDKQILEHLAAKTHIDAEQLAQLDDTATVGKVSSWVRGLFSDSTAYPESYRYHLVNEVLEICRKGGVIMDRGAHVILAARPAFRVRIIGSLESCAERVAAREGIAMEAARAKVQKVNRERDDYLFNMFKRHLHDASLFDLVVNTDRFPDMDSVAELILVAMAQSGHSLPPQPGKGP